MIEKTICAAVGLPLKAKGIFIRQVNKINNFIMILSSLFSLLWLINCESVYEKHKNVPIINPDTWVLIRDFYDMLFRYFNNSWKLLWSKGGYRNSINAKIGKDRKDDQEADFISFEQYLSDEYDNTFYELISFVLQIIGNFEELKETLRVKTGFNEKVKPVVFPNNHMHLQPKALKKLKETMQTAKGSLLI